MNIKNQKIKISGLHCQSCKTLIEAELKDLPGIKSCTVDFKNGFCDVEFDRDRINFEKIIGKITALGYKPGNNGNGMSFNLWFGLLSPIIIGALILIYYLLSQTGAFTVLAKLNEKNIGYGLIFLIGLLASFHCVGMCGGLVVAYSAGVKNHYNNFSKYSLHLLYNGGRVFSYALVGALLGGIGSIFTISPIFSGAVMLLAGFFMLLMALNLVVNFSLLQKINSFLPQTIAGYIFKQRKNKNPKGPLMIGLLTGLMPCGPLQAMQLYALGTGSAWIGGLSLFIFSLGTVPLMFGFGAFITSFAKKYMNQAFKISALVIAILGIMMIFRGFNSINQKTSPASVDSDGSAIENTLENGEFQTVKMSVTRYGYQPDIIYLKKGIPVRWVIDGSGISGCTNAIQIPSLGIKKNLIRGENIIEFTPTQAGELPFSCWMQMVWGKFIVE